MGDRRQSRELALQALFYLDMDKAFVPEKASENIEAFCANHKDRITQGNESFFLTLINGVVMHQQKIDALLNTYSKNWKISRMPAVDRNIMRIAIFEFLEQPDIPQSVSINEAVEMGKRFGGKESGSFINGVLDRIKNKENTK